MKNLATNLSILIPTFNRRSYLEQCLKSLLVQNCGGYELLVRDNASQDDTSLLISNLKKAFEHKSIKIKYKVNSSNVGFRQNMVEGLKELENQYAMILMDDDFFVDSCGLWSLYTGINSSDSIVLSNASVRRYLVGKEERSVDRLIESSASVGEHSFELVKGRDYFLNAWTRYKPLVLSTVMFDKNVLLESSWESWSKRAALDVNMYNIMSLSGDIALFDGTFTGYRIHEQQDFCSFPLEDAFESHSRILNWYQMAKKSGSFSFFTLLLWRIKTVLLKDEGIIVRLHSRENKQDIKDYFLWLKNFSRLHYVLMRVFMPSCIRKDREKANESRSLLRPILLFVVELRRFVLRVFLHIYRRRNDVDYNVGLFEAIKGVKK